MRWYTYKVSVCTQSPCFTQIEAEKKAAEWGPTRGAEKKAAEWDRKGLDCDVPQVTCTIHFL